MKPYPRSERIGVRIQTALSELLKKKIQDPRIELATISGVQVTSDLRVAYVYYSVFGKAERLEEVREGFESSHGYIKRMLAPKLGLKYMPEIKFVHDKSFDHGSKMDRLLASVSKGEDD